MSSIRRPTPEQIDRALRDPCFPPTRQQKLKQNQARPMPKLPRHAVDGTWCATCNQQIRFGTDLNGRGTQACGCGRSYVPLIGREKVTRYDAGEVRDQENLAQLARRLTPRVGHNHPNASLWYGKG